MARPETHGTAGDASDRAPDAPAPAAAPPPPPPGYDVLVVEDDPEINELVGAYAQLAGFSYRAAHSGGAALDEVHRKPPAVIVLDLMLPDLDGYEICRRVKAEPNGGDVPVVILTAMEGETSRQKGLAAGADDYLTKPFDPDRLMETLARHARKH